MAAEGSSSPNTSRTAHFMGVASPSIVSSISGHEPVEQNLERLGDGRILQKPTPVQYVSSWLSGRSPELDAMVADLDKTAVFLHEIRHCFADKGAAPRRNIDPYELAQVVYVVSGGMIRLPDPLHGLTS